MRNYRPITLLNADYKVYAKFLVARLKRTIHDIVKPAQLGFVPKRNITEATHFLKVVQVALDEDEEDGLIIALDWEKAFDRVSWEFLHKATEALSMGDVMRHRLSMMYDLSTKKEQTRNCRRLRVLENTKEESFVTLYSTVYRSVARAYACPLHAPHHYNTKSSLSSSDLSCRLSPASVRHCSPTAPAAALLRTRSTLGGSEDAFGGLPPARADACATILHDPWRRRRAQALVQHLMSHNTWPAPSAEGGRTPII